MSPRRSPGRVRAAPARAARGAGTRGRRRALGQHFLRDAAVARRIVGLLGPGPPDLVVEVGPGEGALTDLLARAAGRLLAIEVDPALAGALRERYAAVPHVEILEGDAARFDWAALAARRADPSGRILVAGNLPYSAGTAILARVLEAAPGLAAVAPTEAVVMLQREVAERVAAPPGSRAYGSLSVLAQAAARIRLAFVVPPGAFRPPPRVESAVLHLRALAAPPAAIADRERFEAVVRAAFARRRKMLGNALAAGLGLPAERARALAQAAGVNPGRRAETLSLAEFARLAAVVEGPPGSGSAEPPGPA